MKAIMRENPLYEQIYENLRTAIFSGEIRSGERLVDSRVAEKLQVSRSPVREAFRKLEQDGLLENRDGIMYVYEPSLQDIVELYQVRAGLESVAAYWAAQNLTDQQLDDLKRSLEDVKKALAANRPDDIIRLNTYFHETILTASGNLRLQKMMSHIRSLVFLFRSTLFTKYQRGGDFLPEHEAVLQALVDRNEKLAAEEMESHILKDLAHFKTVFLHDQPAGQRSSPSDMAEQKAKTVEQKSKRRL
ncbi:GntR family transcriptional regulator [Effusibacillus dendaii]|uniref:GntR family transcriptional regulator n=1 Tax=Effusibacillus dendaii TaxID=2743772 RepID=A0A7I8DEQ8_9BACL|nr:GntR family transcriptional regulator [Effusibacillus dendaii]BCJ88545.1 GntR family transcriptional regulator [Effusibacillus dendaii]